MSVRLMTLVWDISFPTQSQKLIALKLADYAADDGGSVFPARETLARLSGCSEETAKRVIRCFREAGLLHLIRQGGNGPKDTNEWQLNVPLLRQLAAGELTLAGDVSTLQLEGEPAAVEPVEGLGIGVENKGVKMTPLPELRGSRARLRGSPAPDKGVTRDPQSVTNHQLDSSLARTGACEAGASPVHAEGADPAIIVRRGDPSWGAWVQHAPAKLLDRIEAAGAMEVSALWPGRDSQVLAIISPAGHEPAETKGLSRDGKATAQLTIRRGDASWADWLAALDLVDRPRAEAAGEIICTARWPSDKARLIRIPSAPAPDITPRIIGEGREETTAP